MGEYYPRRVGENHRDVPRDVRKIWGTIEMFKDGRGAKFSKLVASSIYNTLAPETNCWSREDTIFIPIPASTSENEDERYIQFCSEIAEYLNIGYGYGAIHNPCKKDGKVEKAKVDYWSFDPFSCFYSMRVILFDETITTGDTFKRTAEKAIENGAKEVIGIFVGKKCDSYQRETLGWNTGVVNN